MIRIAVCDDDIKLTSHIENLIYKYETTNKFDVDVFFNGEELLRAIQIEERYDLLYLDIEMGEINGIDVAYEIRKFDKSLIIIYITSYVNFAPSAFEVNAFRFLAKPIVESKFENYYKLAVDKIIKKPKYFRYTFKRENFKVLLFDIIYFESKQRITYIKTNIKEEKCYMKLNDVEVYLTENNIYFFRISQSLLVSPTFVYSSKYDRMVLNNNEELLVAVNRREEVNKLFCKIKGGEIID